MQTTDWYQQFLDDFCFGDHQHQLLQAKPSPITWLKYYIDNLKLDDIKGKKNSRKWVEETIKVMGGEEGLSTLQALVLDGDVSTAKYQLERSIQRDDDEFQLDKSVLHYAVLKRNKRMVEMLLTTPGGYLSSIDEGDLITGFTAAQIAVFVQDIDVLYTLLKYGASLDIEDNFGANLKDYLILLGHIPHKRDQHGYKISVYDFPSSTFEEWDTTQLEETFKIKWLPRYTITYEYIEELMFSGFQLGQKDEKFREKYLDTILNSSGDDNIFICKIDDSVGWGAFSKKDIKKDEYVVTYGGQFISEDNQKDRSYSMQCGIEGVILDSSQYRNLASFINHSTKSNVESTCVFHRGVELAVIIATRDIARGEQILLNYGDNYFEKIDKSNFVNFAECDANEFPLTIKLK